MFLKNPLSSAHLLAGTCLNVRIDLWHFCAVNLHLHVIIFVFEPCEPFYHDKSSYSRIAFARNTMIPFRCGRVEEKAFWSLRQFWHILKSSIHYDSILENLPMENWSWTWMISYQSPFVIPFYKAFLAVFFLYLLDSGVFMELLSSTC